VRAYASRISGPLLDRIDLHASVPLLRYEEIAGPVGESSERVALRVRQARERQLARGAPNADLRSAELRACALLEDDARRLIAAAVDRFRLSGRAYDRLLRVARTIADLAASETIHATHVAEAFQLRRALDS
jgi:magnesium chelatase family protein